MRRVVLEEGAMTDAPVESNVRHDVPVMPRATASEFKGALPALGEPVSIAANVVAAIVSFLVLIAAPTILLELMPIPDDIAVVFGQVLPMALLEMVFTAFGIAILFLVIGIALQVWQYRRGFSSWRPLVLAFPIVGLLLVPEALARGGTVRGWAVLGMAIALAFWVHWLAVLAASELTD
jgi:hypothetical protein